MKFKLETAKWEWSKAVKSKHVYRDEEFIRTKTKEEAILAIDYLFNNHVNGLTYTITVFRDGEYFTHLRNRQPCLGSLALYSDAHGPTHSYNPYFPRDIYFAFPDGDIIFIACQSSIDVKSEYAQFLLSEESPWISAFQNKETILFNKGYFILTQMENVNPTAFYSLMRLAGFSGSIYDIGTSKSVSPKAKILLKTINSADPRRICGQKPINTSFGSWKDGFSYVRPFNESIFKTSLPVKLSEFKNLSKTGYPPSFSFDGSYFTSSIKDKFGININQYTKPDKSINKILVEAWDFFKEESLKLGSGFPE